MEYEFDLYAQELKAIFDLSFILSYTVEFENRLSLRHSRFLSLSDRAKLNSVRKVPPYFLDVFLADHQDYRNYGFRHGADNLAETPGGHRVGFETDYPPDTDRPFLRPYPTPRQSVCTLSYSLHPGIRLLNATHGE